MLTVILLCVASLTAAETDTIVLLHTNDLHDHLRPDYDGAGGMPYVSGYIRGQKALRNDILVLDAGDIMEKGDLVGFNTQSRMMYEAMDRAGIDASAPGNHDDAYGLSHLVECAGLAPSMTVLAINLFDEKGTLLFAPSKVFDVDGVRVGVIGMMRPRDEQSLTLEESAARIAAEARRLEPETHLIVVTCHAGPKDCNTIAQAAPNVDLFVSGHTHQALQNPIELESGALAVQAGSYAEYVGRLEITMDLDTKEILSADASLVAMDHKTIPVDEEMLAWVQEREAALCPESVQPVADLPDRLGHMPLALMGAAALRLAGDADIGFCHVGQILRDSLPAGPVDVNAVFRTGGQRGFDVIAVEISGTDIEAYLNGLARSSWGQTVWSGFRAAREDRTYTTNLDAGKNYKVVMPLKEWDTRFIRYFEERGRGGAWHPEATEIHFTEALVAYIRAEGLTGEKLITHHEALAAAGIAGEN